MTLYIVILHILAVIGLAATLFGGGILMAGVLGWWLDWDDRRAVARFKRKYGA